MDDEADTFVSDDRAVIDFDSPGDTGKAPSPSRDKHSEGVAFLTPLAFVWAADGTEASAQNREAQVMCMDLIADWCDPFLSPDCV